MPIKNVTNDYVTSEQFEVSKKEVEKHFKEVDEHFKEIDKRFEQVDDNFKEIRKILAQHTRALLSIENTMKIYGDMYQVNKDGVSNLNTRVARVEQHLGFSS